MPPLLPPLSDQTLLEDLANSTGGRYLYMPTIDDLFLIVNVIREQVTGDGLVVNERHTASASRVGAWIEADATEATFLVNWSDTTLSWSPREPKKCDEFNVRLRIPNSKLLHPFDPSVRRLEGTGYVAFRVDDPPPGQWWVEVSSARAIHTGSSVGGFVRSPIRLDATITPRRPLRRTPLDVRVDVWDGARGVMDLTGTVCVTAPTASPSKVVTDFQRRLRTLEPLRTVRRDLVPVPFREALAISVSLSKEVRVAIEHQTSCSPLKKPAAPGGGGGIGQPGGGGVGGIGVTPGGGRGVVAPSTGTPGGGGIVVRPGGSGGLVVTGEDLTATSSTRRISSGSRIARSPPCSWSGRPLCTVPIPARPIREV